MTAVEDIVVASRVIVDELPMMSEALQEVWCGDSRFCWTFGQWQVWHKAVHSEHCACPFTRMHFLRFRRQNRHDDSAVLLGFSCLAVVLLDLRTRGLLDCFFVWEDMVVCVCM